MITKREIEVWMGMARRDRMFLADMLEVSIDDAYRVSRAIDPRKIAYYRSKFIALPITASLLSMAEMLEAIAPDGH